MINNKFRKFHLILASRSPRRHYLLKELGLDFEIRVTDVAETWPEGLSPVEIAIHLAELKAANFDSGRMQENELVITADTLVTIDGEILGKPAGHDAAAVMLKKLSGRKHDVITAVCLKSRAKQKTFFVRSSVTFKELSSEEINYYISNFRPFDKAGGYGIQEWIGYVGISGIEGSFFNVMGLPVMELYNELMAF